MITPPRRLFSAELRMLKERGVDTDLTAGNAQMPMPMQGLGAADGVSNKEILTAINELNSVLTPEPEESEAVPVDGIPEDLAAELEKAETLKREPMALSDSIQETKAELRTLRAGNRSGEKFMSATTELDAVVEATEGAIHTILEATERIDQLAEQLQLHASTPDDRAAADEILECTIKVLEACNFQDITGQRITKVVGALLLVEERVNAMVDIWGTDEIDRVDSSVADESDSDKDLLNGPALADEGISQDDIDALFD